MHFENFVRKSCASANVPTIGLGEFVDRTGTIDRFEVDDCAVLRDPRGRLDDLLRIDAGLRFVGFHDKNFAVLLEHSHRHGDRVVGSDWCTCTVFPEWGVVRILLRIDRGRHVD